MSRQLLILVLGAALAGCATSTAIAPGSAPRAVSTQVADDASPYGLFLAGQAATHDGRLNTASGYLGRAAVAEGGPGYLKVAAFRAALRAGDIASAASLAPTGDDVDGPDRRLGVLVRAVDAMS